MRLNEAIALLAEAGVDSPDYDARILAAEALGIPHLALRPSDELTIKAQDWIVSRAQREPLQHILGKTWFGPLELAVGPGVFIPRPETEILADWAARTVATHPNPIVVDLCAGTGALGLYISHACPQAQITWVEKSPQAFEWLQKNVGTQGPVLGDATDPALLSHLHGRVDLLVSNPPYVPTDPTLSPEVYFDPDEAVFAGDDGLDVLRAMMETMAALLADGALLGLEHDETHGAQVEELLRSHGAFEQIQAMNDLTGRRRFTIARRRRATIEAKESPENPEKRQTRE